MLPPTSCVVSAPLNFIRGDRKNLPRFLCYLVTLAVSIEENTVPR
jgi:hypothetical protein